MRIAYNSIMKTLIASIVKFQYSNVQVLKTTKATKATRSPASAASLVSGNCSWQWLTTCPCLSWLFFGNKQQEPDNRKQTTGNRQQETDNRNQTTGNRQQETDNRKQTTGNRQQEIYNRKQATGNRSFIICIKSQKLISGEQICLYTVHDGKILT